MATKQRITKSKFHNKDTDLGSPNANWDFSEEHEKDNEDCECKPQDDIKFDGDTSDAEMAELLSNPNQNHIENQEIE